MAAFDSALHVLEHNRRQRMRMILYAVAAAPLWVLAYWIVKVLVAISIGYFAGRGWIAPVTRTVMSILAIEGVRYGKQVFDLAEFAHSFYHRGLTGTESERNLRWAASTSTSGAISVIVIRPPWSRTSGSPAP